VLRGARNVAYHLQAGHDDHEPARFARKLRLIGVLFLAPIAVLISFLNDKIVADVTFTEAERAGVEQPWPEQAVPLICNT